MKFIIQFECAAEKKMFQKKLLLKFLLLALFKAKSNIFHYIVSFSYSIQQGNPGQKVLGEQRQEKHSFELMLFLHQPSTHCAFRTTAQRSFPPDKYLVHSRVVIRLHVPSCAVHLAGTKKKLRKCRKKCSYPKSHSFRSWSLHP